MSNLLKEKSKEPLKRLSSFPQKTRTLFQTRTFLQKSFPSQFSKNLLSESLPPSLDAKRGFYREKPQGNKHFLLSKKAHKKLKNKSMQLLKMAKKLFSL